MHTANCQTIDSPRARMVPSPGGVAFFEFIIEAVLMIRLTSGVMWQVPSLVALVLACCLQGFSTASEAAEPEMRTWTDRTGAFSRRACFEKLENGVVHIRDGEGKTAKVPLEKLSAADQAYVEAIRNKALDPFVSGDSPRPMQRKVSATEPPPAGPGKVEINSFGMGFVRIPAGEFTMGDGDASVHVTLTQPFHMGTTEVTQKQYHEVMRTAKHPEKDLPQGSIHMPPRRSPPGQYAHGWQVGDDVAKTFVRWADALAFCKTLTEREREAGVLTAGDEYRLPTEAEWEYACRAGTNTRYWFGDRVGDLSKNEWCRMNTADGRYIRKVGAKKPNPWGLYDMHGNALEWCSDWYSDELSGGVNPKGPDADATGQRGHVLRGGSITMEERECTSSKRIGIGFGDFATLNMGFRVVRSGPGSATEDLGDASAKAVEAVSELKGKEKIRDWMPSKAGAAIRDWSPDKDNALGCRSPANRRDLLLKCRRADDTEAAVNAALNWLALQQSEKSGLWSLRGPYSDGGRAENQLAATSMALLALQGAGNTTSHGRFAEVVDRAWRELLTLQHPDGSFENAGVPSTHRFYSHALMTIALCEMYAMTRDPRFASAAERAVSYLVNSQGSDGGWRYEPLSQGDMSVTGWCTVAIKAASLAGIDVPAPTSDRIGLFLDSVSQEVQGTLRYGYRKDTAKKPAGPVTLASTASGLTCRAIVGSSHGSAGFREGVE